MLIKWLGHASFLIKTREKNIYIDPYVGDYSKKADTILITHSHRDHCDLEKISKIRQPDTVILTTETCAKGIPEKNVFTISPGMKKELNGVTIYAVEAYNTKRFRSPGVPYHPKGTGVGFIVESEGKKIYHAGDTDYLPSMNELECITLALLPIMGRAVMDVNEAVDAAIGIRPKMVMPMHWMDSDPQEFKEKVESRSDLKVIVKEEGEEFTI
jgi:L-ascorbate metabolism protein UlaG (beta-lactamase superfamily)